MRQSHRHEAAAVFLQPKMNGHQFCAKFRETVPRSMVPVIMVSCAAARHSSWLMLVLDLPQRWYLLSVSGVCSASYS